MRDDDVTGVSSTQPPRRARFPSPHRSRTYTGSFRDHAAAPVSAETGRYSPDEILATHHRDLTQRKAIEAGELGWDAPGVSRIVYGGGGKFSLEHDLMNMVHVLELIKERGWMPKKERNAPPRSPVRLCAWHRD